MNSLIVLAAAMAPLAAGDDLAPRPRTLSAVAVATAEIIRFERASPDPQHGTAVLQCQVNPVRREIAFF